MVVKKMNSFSEAKLENKTVLLRADINSNVLNGKVFPSERIKQSAKTIKNLKNKKAKIVVIAHQGRVGKEDFVSLKQHAKILNKFVKITFVPDILGKKAESKIKNLKAGEAILLENIRNLNEEFTPGNTKKNKLVRKLSKLCDVYINDSFSVCHRRHTSVVSFPDYLESYTGPSLEKEIESLSKIKLDECLYVLGGAKPEDNLKLIGKNKILSCGFFGQMCAIANGVDLGAQNEFLKKNISNYDSVLEKLKEKMNKNLVIPSDFAVKIKKKRRDISIKNFPSKYEIFDIGKKTQKKYLKEVRKAKSVYMKGPVGFYFDRKFSRGTFKILKAISKKKGFSLLGGGHLADALRKSKIPKSKFGYISISGGASLNYLAGEKLPGLEALKR